MNGLHLVQVNEYVLIVCMKHKRKTYVFLVSKHSVVWRDLCMRAKVDKSENKKKNSLSDQKSLIQNQRKLFFT